MTPGLFFYGGNPLWLTVEGEFVIKNVVLLAAGLVIAGHELQPPGGREEVHAYPPNVGERGRESLAS